MDGMVLNGSSWTKNLNDPTYDLKNAKVLHSLDFLLND
jgi:hypothetical protein